MKELAEFKKFKRTYKFVRTVPTNIARGYLSGDGGWGIWEMVRETVQNSLDEAQYMAETSGGELTDYIKLSNVSCFECRDFGRGVEFGSILFIGESGKRGTHFRGQKGEGEIMSFLVAAQNQIEKWMFSKDWAATARFSKVDGYDILVFDYYQTSEPIKGTIVRYPRMKDLDYYFSERKAYFPDLDKIRKKRLLRNAEREQKVSRKLYRPRKVTEVRTASNATIFIPKRGSSKLFVKGIYVREISSLFSYNFRDEQVVLNRDRNMISDFQVFEAIQSVLDGDEITDSQIRYFWKKATEKPESLEYLHVMNFIRNRDRFEKAFKQVYKKACVQTNPAASHEASLLGFKVLSLPYSVQETAKNLGLPVDTAVINFDGDFKFAKDSAKIRTILNCLRRLGRSLGLTEYPIQVASKCLSIPNDGDNVYGFYQDGMVTLMESLFSVSLGQVVKTYIHEVGHGMSHASDGSRVFVNFFEDVIFDLLVNRPDVASLLSDLQGALDA